MSEATEPEIAALKIILMNVVARLSLGASPDSARVREMLGEMRDECRLAAERAAIASVRSDDRGRIVNETVRQIDEFFKGITIT